nr:MAG TPA: hypothetical protein [Caudoviricetes sp.]
MSESSLARRLGVGFPSDGSYPNPVWEYTHVSGITFKDTVLNRWKKYFLGLPTDIVQKYQMWHQGSEDHERIRFIDGLLQDRKHETPFGAAEYDIRRYDAVRDVVS